MARGINKVIVDPFLAYEQGASLPEVSEATGIPVSTLRFRLHKAGALRSRAEGVRLAGKKGKLGGGLRGRTRVFSDDHKRAISAGRAAWGEMNARGFRTTTSGYIEYTRGPNKGRLAHVVAMEERIGRRLLEDEVVHHVDGNKQNNHQDNLALMTRAGHARLHRREKTLKERANG